MTEMPRLTDARLTCENRVAELTFDRDDVRNALTGTTLVEDIIATIDWANRNSDLSVLILTGDGAAFSAGGNVKQMRDREGIFSGSVLQIQDQYRRGIQQLPLAMQRAEIPVIAAVNGPAIGAGMDLACMCDLRIGSTRALFGETFLNLGIIPGDGGAWFLPRLVGAQRAAELIFSGRLVKADEALELGLLLEVVDQEELLPRARELAARIAAQPPQALRLGKRLLRLGQKMDLPEFLDLCAAFQAMAHQTEDHIEAINAFLEKRPPRFRGC
ncbi:enoyl-CoA hydratase/carnithine racemase [Geothermobacter ehrlichii]|uniref:Enoyl-CoA hydratase/carnithine racemase n=1 Tax=Geothermobacter ehrlichii TaxID=213224 RepID=A0A5D3WFP2_9BACT|nr:crotonase/enoyl-CoA hydratase family protein [Geothermobacter ehrlichii]TYO95770.1 enoyl-CoA hydratase/carnithine racemase [Geothermobacter ehrlichii]